MYTTYRHSAGFRRGSMAATPGAPSPEYPPACDVSKDKPVKKVMGFDTSLPELQCHRHCA